MERVALTIQNLKCGGCANTVSTNLNRIEGVSDVAVNPDDGTVDLNINSKDLLETIKSELRRLGYPLVDEDNPFFTRVKSYASCAIGRMSSTES